MGRIGTLIDDRGTKKKAGEIMGKEGDRFVKDLFLTVFSSIRTYFAPQVRAYLFIGASLNTNYDKVCQRNTTY